MIARIWHGWTTPGNADRYEALLKEEIFVGIRNRHIRGFRTIELLRGAAGEEVEFVTIMHFDSLDAVREFAGDDHEAAVVPPRARALLSRFDQRSRHYEVRDEAGGTTSRAGGTQTAVTSSALLLIDVQQGFDLPRWGARNNPGAERQIASLLAAWRQAGWPIVHVQHMSQTPGSPLRAGEPGNAFKPEATPREGEPVFQKTVNSAFIGTGLEAHLRQQGVRSLVIAGLTTDHCISTTARMAGNLGFDVAVAADATATFDRRGPDGATYPADQIHGAELASLHGEFATVQSTAEILDRVRRRP